MRTLLIEDGTPIGDGLKTGLSKMGFSINWFTEGRQGEEALYSTPYNTMTLDLTLPGIDGRDTLREWRTNGKQEPVLILTARDTLVERVGGLRLGADDYLCKPSVLVEVVVRLKALVRRASGQASNTLCHGQVTFDPGVLVATVAGGPLSLKPKEFALLELLMRNRGCVLPHELTEEKLCTWDENVSSNAIEVHVHHLRRKLGSDSIRTMHGIGYTLDDAWDSHNASAHEPG